MKAALRSILALASLTTLAHSKVITLNNQGFEAGLSGWISLGTVSATGPQSVVTSDNTVWDISPFGTTMASMDSSGASDSDLNAFFGLPAGTLQTFSAVGPLTNGAGIYQEFSADGGDTVTMYWDYVARDYIPFNDPAFAILRNPDGTFQVQTLASIYGGGIEVGTSGHSRWQELTFTLNQTGNYLLGFAVFNDDDTVLDAALFLDDQAGQSSATPGLTPSFPILPDQGAGNTLIFLNPTPGFWFDPPFAEAYIYELTGGGTFTEFATPPAQFGFGPLLFTDLLGGTSFLVGAGNITDIAALATSKFMISGIPDGAIDFADPLFATLFPTFLDWTGAVSALSITAVPHQTAIPEPSTFAMLAVGLGFGVLRLRARS